MKDADIRLQLFLTILIMSAAPLIAAFYLLDHSLDTSLNLGFNPQVVRVLDRASDNLRTLGRIDAENRSAYRAQFDQVQSLKHVYSNPALIRGGIEDSLKIYFGFGFVAAVLLAVAAAAVLSRRIALRYRLAFAELTKQRERVRYLQEMASWQELARMLAHEIKNPLTPIEVLVSSLARAYLVKGEAEFRAQLAQTQSMINEELKHLKNTVNRFGEFAKLPQIEARDENVAEVLEAQLQALANQFEASELRMHGTGLAIRARVDATLFRQVLANVIRNGLEANPGRRVAFDLHVGGRNGAVEIRIANDGAPIPVGIAPRIFDPYVSTKSGKDNMGLGLAIVKKIVLEHGGDIAYAEQEGRPTFIISLPASAS
jgi:signal transduction histidine kinase